MDMDVLCIGYAAYDISMFISEYPAEDSKSHTDTVLECGGGPAANAAYSLSIWGKRCAFAGLVGDDSHGRQVLSEFESAGTDISLLEVREGYPTALSLILVNRRNGSRTIVSRKIEQCHYRPDRAVLTGMQPEVLLLDGHELEASLDAVTAFPRAKSILDAGSLRQGTEVLSRKVDYLVSSERFALEVTGLADLACDANREKALRDLRDVNGKTVVITLGEMGLVFDAGEGPGYLPAYPAKAVDTTAAGDIFHGGFACGVAEGMTLDQTLRFASMAASLSVREMGGRSSIPSIQRIREALARAEQGSGRL